MRPGPAPRSRRGRPRRSASLNSQASDAHLTPGELDSAGASPGRSAPRGDGVEREIRELRKITNEQRMDLNTQIAILEARAQELREAIARDPSPWQTVQLARHPERPKVGDYIAALARDFVE